MTLRFPAELPPETFFCSFIYKCAYIFININKIFKIINIFLDF